MGDIPLPKVLIMLKNKPLILYLLEELEKITQLIEPVVVVGYMHEKVRTVLGDGYIYALQEPQLGTANALLVARNKIKAENILVLYGDMPFIKAESLKSLINLHHQKGTNISMFFATVPNFEGIYESLKYFGRAIRKNGNVTKIVEYYDATEAEKQITEINPGIYMFNTKWLWENIRQIKNQNAQGEYYLTDIVEVAIKQGVNINFLPIEPKEVIGINSKEELEIAEKILQT
jgi:bifunctional N-acetylglucosamine-1-phosphate-uridyltransferase/glucosamine-1-phosphate-acetyltransferase GlmU-like protein